MFGDIGTSPITIQTAFNPNDPLPVPISTDNVYGVVSLIFWSVMIIVTLTYVTLVMRADNDGGGSIMALITLLRWYGGARGRRTAMTLAALGLFGAALFFGESMITPAISPGSDRNSLNRAVPAVLADGGSVLIIDERVADAFAAPADDLERHHYAWAGGRDVVGPGTTIQRHPRDGEPWVRAAMFSLLEATRDRGRELAAGGKGKPCQCRTASISRSRSPRCCSTWTALSSTRVSARDRLAGGAGHVRHRAVGMADPPPDRHERRAVHRRAPS